MEQNGLKRCYIQVISNHITTELRTKGNLNTTGGKNIVILQNRSVLDKSNEQLQNWMIIVVEPRRFYVKR